MKLVEDRYCIQEVAIEQLVADFGEPLYIYDGNKIKTQYHRLKEAFDVPKLRINYACKALTNINVLRLLKNEGCGLDAVSIEEIKLGLHAGFKAEDILFTPNGVSKQEIDAAISLGVGINIDNIETLEYIGHEYPGQPVGIRINPHVMAGGNSKISVGHIDSKFGISFHQVPLIKRIVDALNIPVQGIHMHTGSDILDVEVFLRAADILFSVAKNFEDLAYIDFGSGFKVAYKEGDIATDIEELGHEMSQRFHTFCKNYGQEMTLMFEPGKYLVSEAGYFAVKTNVVKQTTSTMFAGVNTGLNHLIRPMFYNSYHDIVNISNPSGKPRIYTVVGYICETDTFAYNRKIAEITAGDILVFKNAGAYCFSMASNYNARLLPPEVLILDNEVHLIRKGQTFEELLTNQIVCDF